MAASTKETLAQADIILNRTNVALARSQRLIASWLPIKEIASHTQPTEQPSDEEDLQGDSELGGIGSKLQKDEPGLPDGAFRRRKLGSNDKLLEQLLGRKGAGQHRKAKAHGGRGGGLEQSAPKPKPEDEERRKRKVRDVESDEEDGRAAAFRSRRPRKARMVVESEQLGDEPAEAPQRAIKEQQSEEVKTPQPPKPAAKPGKTRPPSYLDEVLAKKANKKNKKKQSA